MLGAVDIGFMHGLVPRLMAVLPIKGGMKERFDSTHSTVSSALQTLDDFKRYAALD